MHYLLFYKKPFMLQHPHTNSPHWSPYRALKNLLKEFEERSKHFPFGDHFITTHNLSSGWCTGIVRRKLMFFTVVTADSHLLQVFMKEHQDYLIPYSHLSWDQHHFKAKLQRLLQVQVPCMCHTYTSELAMNTCQFPFSSITNTHQN